MTEQERQYVEDIALHLETEGLPRMAGRIVGVLLVADPNHRSLDELRADLGASKGSVSTMTRLLEQLGFLERFSVAGTAKTRYRLRRHVWLTRVQQNVEKATKFRQVTQRGLELLVDEPPETRDRIEALHRAASFWENELPRIANELQRARQTTAAS